MQRVAGKKRAVRTFYIGKQTDYLARPRTPRQHRKRFGIGEQQQIADTIGKTRHGCGIEQIPVVEYIWQLLRHDRNVLLPPEQVAKRELNEFYIVFFRELQYLFGSTLHNESLRT